MKNECRIRGGSGVNIRKLCIENLADIFLKYTFLVFNMKKYGKKKIR